MSARQWFSPSVDAWRISYGGPGKYYPNIDGLRGYAVLAVVGYHLLNLPGGWMGVDLFFVLSGFLITGKLLLHRHHRNGLKQFYLRRLLRIFPLYYLTLLLYFFLSERLGIQQEVQWWPLILFCQNFVIGLGHSFGWYTPDGLKHFWSIAVEEHFYLLFPCLVVLLGRNSLTFVLIVLILISMLIRIWLSNIGMGMAAFVLTPCRLDGLCIGALLALYLRQDMIFKGWIMLICSALVAAMALYTINQFSPLYLCGGLTILSLGALTLVLFALTHHPLADAFLGNAVVVHLGKLSYGIYVFHYVVQFLAEMAAKKYFPTVREDSGQLVALVLASTYLLARMSFSYIEKPLMDWGKTKIP